MEEGQTTNKSSSRSKKRRGRKSGTSQVGVSQSPAPDQVESPAPNQVVSPVRVQVESPASDQVEAPVQESPLHFSFRADIRLGNRVAEVTEGVIRSNIGELGYSFIKANEYQVKKIELLSNLCKKHVNLLNVSHVFRDSSGQATLLAEKGRPVEEYFSEILQILAETKNGPISNEEWWNHISEQFWLIFAGIIQALIYLHRNGEICGDLSFGAFVINSTEGKILPSMKPCKDEDEDVTQVISLMKSVLKLAQLKYERTDKFSVQLPVELGHLLNFVGDIKRRKGVPTNYWLDHPYFWSASDRITFVQRLHDLIKTKKIADITEKSYVTSIKQPWWCNLEGCLKKVWEKGEEFEVKGEGEKVPRGCYRVKPYREGSDIVRFYNAALTHADEYNNNKIRIGKADIESLLRKEFPTFYMDMFQAMSACFRKSSKLKAEDLLTLVNFSFGHDIFSTNPLMSEWSE